MKKVLFISSVGGHLTQLLELQKLFDSYNYVIVTEKTDVTVDMKKKFKKVKFLKYGSREYLFSYFFIFGFNVFKSFLLFLKYRPQVIVTTGTHTAVPMCYIAKFFRRKIIYIESYAKRLSPTLAGKIIYPIADEFIIQWETLYEFYPKAKFYGTIY